MESLFNKVAGFQTAAQVFSVEYCKIFKNIFFEEHLRTTASRYYFAKPTSSLKRTEYVNNRAATNIYVYIYSVSHCVKY